MSQHPTFAERVEKAFVPDACGVVGVVDELLALCGDELLQLEWKDGACLIDQSVQVPLPKSAFRAMLARLAALCNEHKPDSVSPYGGAGELAFGNPPKVFRVSFMNTPAEQCATIQRANEIDVSSVPVGAPVQKVS